MTHQAGHAISGSVDYAEAGYFFIDATGCFRRVNEAWLRMHGYTSADEVLGRHFSLTQVESDLEKARQIVALVLSGRPVPAGEFTRRNRDGSVGFHTFSLHPVKDGERVVGLEGFLIDTTGLRLLREQYIKLFESMTEGVALHELVRDSAGTPVDYRIVDVNPAYETHTGLPVAQARGALASRLYASAPPPYLDLYVIVAREGQPRSFETYFPPMRKHFRITVYSLGQDVFVTVFMDITEREQADREREATIKLLRLLNAQSDLRRLMQSVAEFLQELSGCEAVGLRLNDGPDYPYFETRGFSSEFVRAENRLCLLGPDGQPQRDSAGNPVLECMCGHVLAGRFDPAKPFFTAHGSFWSNCTTELLASTTEADRQARTRNRCHGEGYESVALIPLRMGQVTLGLLQLNDRCRGKFSPPLLALLEQLADSVAIAVAQRRAEAALRASEDRYRRLYENSPLGYQSLDADGRFLDVNQAWLETLGYNREEVIGHWFGEFLAPAMVEAFRQRFPRFKAVGAVSTEFEMKHKDGSLRVISFDGRVAYDDQGQFRQTHCVLHDVTDRKRDELALLAAKEEWERTFDAVPDLITILDQDHRILRANRAMAERLGRRPAELIGRRCHDLVHGAAVTFPGCPRICTMKDGRVHSLEAAEPRLGGEFLVTTSPICDQLGRIMGCVHVARDVTAQKNAERARRAAEEQLRQAQKMESVGRLAGGVAHDFNNLLTPILGYAELLLDQSAPGDGRREELDQIRQAAERARDLTRQLLTFGRRQVLDLKPVDLRQVLTGFEKLLRRAVREDIRITLHQPPVLSCVRADIGQIEQMVMNLVVNAQDAMPGGGLLEIELSTVALDDAPAAAVPGLAPGRYVLLTVSDTGLGMSQEVLDHLFEPFFTTKGQGQGQGTGLGLATVFGIVEQHGGQIRVSSAPGQGSTFKIYLPQAEESLPSPPPETAAQRRHAGGSETILVVEDNEAVRKMACQVLEFQGYEVLAAESAAHGLEILRSRSGPVHLVLTDVVMPGMNGRELYARLAPDYPTLKVLYMSGYTDEVIAHRGLAGDGSDIIQKPFSVETLTARVREALDNPKK